MRPVNHIITDLSARGLLELAVAISSEHGVLLDDMLGGRRFPSLVRARSVLWLAMHERLHWSYPEIARLFGAHHTTVLVGVRKVAGDPEAIASVDAKEVA